MCLGCGHTDQSCSQTVTNLVRSMEHADQQGYDSDALSALYDSLEERYGAAVARALWMDACKEYDRLHA